MTDFPWGSVATGFAAVMTLIGGYLTFRFNLVGKKLDHKQLDYDQLQEDNLRKDAEIQRKDDLLGVRDARIELLEGKLRKRDNYVDQLRKDINDQAAPPPRQYPDDY